MPGLNNIRLHKYAAVDKSLLSKFVLQPFWTRVALYVPKSVHPNALTLFGFFLTFCNCLVAITFDSSLQSPLPYFCFPLFAFNLFAYQTLDAIDGKHARALNLGSPTGELLDHGCDSLVPGFSAIAVGALLGGPASPVFFFSFLCAISAFFLVTLETYFTHVLYLGYVSGPVEGLLYCIFVILYLNGVRLNDSNFISADLFWALGGFGAVFTASGNLLTLRNYKNGLLSAAPIVAVDLLALLWYSIAPHRFVGGPSIVPIILGFTFLVGHLVAKVLLAHMLKNSSFVFSATFVPLVFLILADYFSISLPLSCWIFCIFAITNYLVFATQNLSAILNFLGINFLAVPA